ncbi:hypothetical protein MMC12_001566 [Toensbergia leucococca]|nr:hypothetical protein [Toensbergia leucococca]
MSTFKGVVEEFPEIRIDYFRTIAGRTPPSACFLSHVHSDHLRGLESLKAPFVYCSAATKELLLRLEKYPHRMNFAKGILESRKQHYKNLKNLLKTIPLSTPTEIELWPKKSIRVTLLDANHCAGAVMFLIEDETKAVLYTGDIRSEPWWVNALVRNPVVLPYTQGNRLLDKIYLDTTFATSSHLVFPTKADGIKELLTKVSEYPDSTVFHLDAWTFGYEDVWIALASALRSQVHVDKYKFGLYSSLALAINADVPAHEGPALSGYRCGNRTQSGCLTSDQAVKLHSCERGTSCTGLESPDVVWITPILSRDQGVILPELGTGGGAGDLTQDLELELDDAKSAIELMKLCSRQIFDAEARSKTLDLISKAIASDSKSVSLEALDLDIDNERITFETLAAALARATTCKEKPQRRANYAHRVYSSKQRLPRNIEFPYSRHSSYEELCHLVEAFKPLDVYPCTTDEENWTQETSIEALFGSFCSGTNFVHDREMALLVEQRKELRSRALKRQREQQDSRQDPARSRQRFTGSQHTGNPDVDQDATLVDPSHPLPQAHLLKLTECNETLERPSKRRRVTDPAPTDEKHDVTQSNRASIQNIIASFNDWLKNPTNPAPINRTISDPAPQTNSNLSTTSKSSFQYKSTSTNPSPIEPQQSSKEPTRSKKILATDPRISPITNLDGTTGRPSPHPYPSRHPQSLTRRTDAYNAALQTNGLAWADFSPITSSGGHGVLEVEL